MSPLCHLRSQPRHDSPSLAAPWIAVPVALVVMLIGTPGAAQMSFSGEVDAQGLWSLETGTLVLDAESEVVLRAGDWEASTSMAVGASVWEAQSLRIAWAGRCWSGSSRLRLEPCHDRLKDWDIEWAYRRGEWEAAFEYRLTRTRRWLTFDVEGALGDVNIDGRLRLRASTCASAAFYDAQLTLTSGLCGADVTASVTFDAGGFDHAVLSLDDFAVPELPWLLVDIEIERQADTTEVGLDPTLRLGTGSCASLALEGNLDDGTLSPLRLVALRLEGEISNVEVEAVCYWDSEDWIDDRYASRLSFEVDRTLAQDRGLTARFELFCEGGPSTGMMPRRSVVSINVELARNLSTSVGADVCADAGLSGSLSFGFAAAW
jgi:hypothetical protein